MVQPRRVRVRDPPSDNIAANAVGLFLGFVARFFLFRTFVFQRKVRAAAVEAAEVAAVDVGARG